MLIVGLSLTDRGAARWLGIPPLLYGGKISYCLYLVHFVVMDVVVTCYWQDDARRGTVPPALALGLPLMVLASFVLAAALHHGVEEPGRRLLLTLLRRGTDRVGQRVPERPVPRHDSAAAVPAADLLGRRGAPDPETRRLLLGAPAGLAGHPVRPAPVAVRPRLQDGPPSDGIRSTVGRAS